MPTLTTQHTDYAAGWQDQADPIVPPDGEAWRLSGQGLASPQAAGFEQQAAAGNATILRGQHDGPVVAARRQHWRIHDLGITAAASNPNAVGVRCQNTGAKAQIQRVAFRGLAAAVDIGLVGQALNDNLTLRDWYTAGCGAVLRVRSLQSLAHYLTNGHSRADGVIVDVLGGGDVTVDTLDAQSGVTLLRHTADGKQTSDNNGSFVFRHVNFDWGPATTKIVDQTDPDGTCRVIADRLKWPGERFEEGSLVGPVAEARLTGPRTSLLIRDHANLPELLTLRLTQGAEVRIDGCRIRRNPEELLSGDSTNCRLRVTNSYWRRGSDDWVWVRDGEVRR
ncbi:MAG: hypothetical protein AAF805_02130 [Planctomycetota bacterium]